MQKFPNGKTLHMEGIHYIRMYVDETESSKKRFRDWRGRIMDFNSFPIEYYGLYGGFNRQQLDETDKKIVTKPVLVNTADIRLGDNQDIPQEQLDYNDMYNISIALRYKPKPENNVIHFTQAPYDFTYMDTIIRKGEYYPEKYTDFEPIGENPVKWVDYEHKKIYYVI